MSEGGCPTQIEPRSAGWGACVFAAALLIAGVPWQAWAADARPVAGPEVGELPPTASADNLALGRPYTTSAWPNYKVYKRAKNPPDFATALTDGRYASRDPEYKAFIFSRSDTALVFSGASEVEVIVDLGAVSPIRRIYTRHASTAAGTFLPRRELYYVSVDGEEFFQIGEYVNRSDPPERRFDARKAKELGYFRGVKIFDSGEVQAVGRYVLVRTHASGIWGAKVNPTHVDYDEIVVERGRFDVADAPALAGPAHRRSPDRLEADVLGWRLDPPSWFEMFREGPLSVGLNPHYFYGDDAYHLSVQGMYVLSFRGLMTRELKLDDVGLQLELPREVEIVTHRKTWQLAKPKQIEREGRAYVRYDMTWVGRKAGGKKTPNLSSASMPFLVVTAETAGDVGRGFYRYRYGVEGQRFEGGEKSFDIVVHERIGAPAPRRMSSSVWFMKMSVDFADHRAAVDRYLGFYREVGYNTLRALPDRDVSRRASELGMTYVGITSIARNGYEFDASGSRAWREGPGALFQFHPRFDKNQQPGAMCPTVMASAAFRPKLDAAAEKLLGVVDHTRINFEPYPYQKRGCICEQCKASYRAYAGISEAEVESQWPDVVISKSAVHDRFASWQLGQAVKAVQDSVRRAGKKLGKPRADFVLAATYRDFDPADRSHAIKDPHAYIDGVDQLVSWNFPYSIDAGSFDLLRYVGSNLRALRDYRNALALVRAEQKRRGTPHIPALTNSCGILYPGELRLGYPRDYYFSVVLTFLMGFEGHTSYTEAGTDARYMRLRAEANRVMATYEDLVFDGRPLEGLDVAPEVPLPNLRGEHAPTRDIVFSAGWQHGGSRLVALGNDHIEKSYVRLRLALPDRAGPTVHLFDRIAGRIVTGTSGVPRKELARDGVVIELAPKSFAILEVREQLDDSERLPSQVVEPAAAAAAAQADELRLAASVAMLEALDQRANRD